MPTRSVVDIDDDAPDSSVVHFDPNDRQYRVCCCCHAQSVARFLSVLFIIGLLAVLPYTLDNVYLPFSPLPVVHIVILGLAAFRRNRFCLGFLVGVLALLLTALMIALFLLTATMLWTYNGLTKESITEKRKEEILLFFGLVVLTAAAALIVFWIYLVFRSFLHFVRDKHRAAKLPCIVERPTTSINSQPAVNEEFGAPALGHLENLRDGQNDYEMYPASIADSAYASSSDSSDPARGPSAPPVPLYPVLHQGSHGAYGW